MIRHILLMLAVLGSQALFCQEIRLTFTGTGEVTEIDSIRATNLSTGQSVTIPGGAILVLGSGSGTDHASAGESSIALFPNPFSGETTLAMTSAIQQDVLVFVRNMAGQLVVQERARLDPGTALFSVSVRVPGFYTITVSGDKISVNAKMLCTGSGLSVDAIWNIGTVTADGSGMLLKTAGYVLGFSPGDIIEFAVMSGKRTTIFTDSPTGTHNYPVELVGCSDNGGNSYPVVMIGDQTWMGRNLALLPSVSPSETGSEDSPVYYVFGYEGSNTAAARDIGGYATYGVLYNWHAARISCPEGWSLPADADWQVLEKYLGMSADDAGAFSWRASGDAGGKLKEAGLAHWSRPNAGASDIYGFNALPGSYRSQYPGFYNLGFRGYFWTSTQNGGGAYYRALINESAAIDRGLIGFEYGFSVRCLKGGGQSVELPSVTTAAVSGITKVSAVSGGTVTADGGSPVTLRGVCWNSGGSPQISDPHTEDDSGMGDFVSNISGLTAGTPYYVRAYATNIVGTAYGPEIQFTTATLDALPVVTTDPVTGITQTTAASGGSVTFEGNTPVTARGVCWNTTGQPVITDFNTVDGTGTGAFTSSITGLKAATPYYVRAYATNAFGTAYGETMEFTTAFAGEEGTFEYDGRTYAYKSIGQQTWMTENLAYLPSVNTGVDGSVTDPKYYVYDYHGSSVSDAKATPFYQTYGVLYNWEAAKTACPGGWHLPTYQEWSILLNFLITNGYGYGGSGNDIAKSLASTSGWRSTNSDDYPGGNQAANNTSGFNALPAGGRSVDGEFDGLLYTDPIVGEKTAFWPATPDSGIDFIAWYLHISYFYPDVSRWPDNKGYGMSVRCLKNL